MNVHRAFQISTAVALSVTISSSAFALEATATNHDAANLNTFDMKLQTFQTLLTAALNELTHRIDVCTAAAKLYGPTHPDKDADNCVTQVTSNTLPSADLCDVGEPPVGTGSTWTCQKTFTSPQSNGRPCIWNAPTTVATGNKFCQTRVTRAWRKIPPARAGAKAATITNGMERPGSLWVMTVAAAGPSRPLPATNHQGSPLVPDSTSQ